MPTQGKKFRSAAAKVDRAREYQIPQAVGLVKGSAFAKFDETVDVAVRLGVDPRHADQVVRGTVVLPHGTGKPVRVLVVTQGERVREAVAAGADFVGIEYIQKLKDGWLECDVIVATPDVMGQRPARPGADFAASCRTRRPARPWTWARRFGDQGQISPGDKTECPRRGQGVLNQTSWRPTCRPHGE
jgi:hypothetical protein